MREARTKDEKVKEKNWDKKEDNGKKSITPIKKKKKG